MTDMAIPDDNTYVNIKSFLLDPLSVIVKLAILANKPVGTKLLIYNNVIYCHEPGIFQTVTRMMYKTNKTSLQYMFNPINLACLHFLSPEFVHACPRIVELFQCAAQGVQRLTETYRGCSIIALVLNYYYVLLVNHLRGTYNDSMFVRDNMTAYYTTELCRTLHSQWTETNVKIVLDLISFYKDTCSAAATGNANIKSLETIMDGIDMTTRTMILDTI